MRRVVVTGMGVVSPLGVGIDTFWDGLINGRSGVRRITRFDPSPYPSQIAGEVPDFDATAYLSRRDTVRTDVFIHYALISAQAALADSGVKIDGQNDRVGVSIGTGMGGVPMLLNSWDMLQREGMLGVSAYALPGSLPNMAAGWVSMRSGARGPIFSPTTACAASSQAVGDAFRAIQRGDADVMLAGGTDSLIHPVVVAGFSAIHALSTRNDAPSTASRPFDKDRDGFVLAEGAGVLVLEVLEAARARGARIYAELLGYGLSADAHHPTASSADGPARAMRLALGDAKVAPEAVDYINAHGTSTPLNDQHETEAIKAVFGEHARRLAISSIKSMTGHLVGAAGAVEAIATALALHHGILPPTINYTTPDPACDLDYVPNQARRAPLRVAMSNSFAFGGTNSILVLGRGEAWVATQGVAEGLREIMAARLGLPTEQLVPEARLVEDLGLDSLDAVELAISVERKFDIEVPEEELTKLKTVADMVALVESRVKQAPGWGAELREALINLVLNAVDAMPHGGAITLETREAGDRVLLSIADTGTGIAPDARRRIFEPFFTTKESGTGLGLSIVSGIISSYGGTIDVDSEVGRGTTFTIRLPRA